MYEWGKDDCNAIGDGGIGYLIQSGLLSGLTTHLFMPSG